MPPAVPVKPLSGRVIARHTPCMDVQKQGERRVERGMRTMFWTWAVIIAGGLAFMIALPLADR